MDSIAIELESLEHVFSDASADPIKLSYGLLRSITEDFSIEIGRGGFGAVYMGYLGNGKVAVKKLSNAHDFSDKLLMDEIKCLMRARHKNIVRFLGYCSDTQGEVMEFNGTYVMAEVQKRLLCFEYVPNGNIQHYLQDKPQGNKWHVTYQIIKGICLGLQYLHEERISHLDLKPENVMLDAHMEPKITDFGLSRCLDEGQSNFFTKTIRGTPGYIAPETINTGEVSLKSDIYALGIIVIKLLAGHNNIFLDSWHESINADCPLVKICMEIAQTCIEADQDNRPTAGVIIRKLNEMENLTEGLRNDEGSSIHQVSPCAFPETDELDVYPLELIFPFQPNEQITCTFSLTNKSDSEVGFLIIPDSPDRYRNTDLLKGILMPMSTSAITVEMRAQEKLPADMDKLDIVMLTTMKRSSDDGSHLLRQLMSTSVDEYGHLAVSTDELAKQVEQELGGEVHRATLTVSVIVSESADHEDHPESVDQPKFMDTTCGRAAGYISSIQVHPTEPWILIIEDMGTVHIWNWQTKERIYENHSVVSAKFVARKEWLVLGDDCGSIIVHTCPSMDQAKKINAHDADGRITSLVVHPTRPFMLSYSYGGRLSMKLWDWNQEWHCARIFDVHDTSPVAQATFNPKDTNTFATLGEDMTVKIWRIDYSEPITTLEEFMWGITTRLEYIHAYSGDQNLITGIGGPSASIWDLHKGKHVHTLTSEWGSQYRGDLKAVVCHPTRPVLVTASVGSGGNIHVWDSNTYRLKKTMNLSRWPVDIAFLGSTRLVIAYEDGVGILDMDLE